MERFRLFNKTGDGIHLRKDKSVGNLKDDEFASFKISEDFFNEFGISRDMSVLRLLKKDLANLQIRYILTKKEKLRNNIESLKYEIDKEEKKNDGQGISIIEAKAYLDKEFGFFKLQDISVLDFYTKLKILENGRANKKG